MTSNIDPHKIAQLLTLSSRQLDERISSALRNSRQLALQKQVAHAPALALDTGRGAHTLIPGSLQQWIIAALITAMLIVGTGFWHHLQEQQIVETDLAILTDDLPIDVFVN